ncbi:F-box/LRR-repeat protein 12 [Protobothrops mucrosquamatus]|uniref:F-box/LRR-repeat protein 12 n=1 Tax=Protobothrops mucrosquamatus TaxID=103944 RepID=UPI00077599CB|nr:F-box/LRR-repeat protein 12 [Protobothrops mucrosquamatus]
MMAALSPPTLSSLPDSLLLQILVWLPPRDRVGVTRVCKRWHRLVRDNFLWRHVDLSSCRISSKILWHLLRNYFQGSLWTLKLRGSLLSFRKQEVLTSALMQALGKQCPKLQQLSLMELDLRSFQYGCMPSSLTSLELRCCEIPFVWFQVPDTSCSFPRIQQLAIWNVPAFSNQHLLNIATQSTLKTLILSEVYRITDVGIQAVAPHLKDLQHLSLCHCSIGDSAMHFVGRHLKQLNHLDLRSNSLTDVGLLCLIGLPILESLCLKDCNQLSPETILIVCQSFPSLKHLDLSRIDFEDKIFQKIQLGLPSCTVANTIPCTDSSAIS